MEGDTATVMARMEVGVDRWTRWAARLMADRGEDEPTVPGDEFIPRRDRVAGLEQCLPGLHGATSSRTSGGGFCQPDSRQV